MELLFESRFELHNLEGKVRAIQAKPTIHPDPVLKGDKPWDKTGVSMFGTVLYDQGRYRMWHTAWPQDWDGKDVARVGYAESDDGFTWRKPILNMTEANGSAANSLINLGLGSPTVFIDPHSPPSHRYRATGYASPTQMGAPPNIKSAGYFTAHSADGLHWTTDADHPTWIGSDVITSIYHPGRDCGVTTLKYAPFFGGFKRRSIYTASFQNNTYSPCVRAMVPDDYDDIIARQSGHVSADYYGMGMMPAGRQGIVGFLQHFRHYMPRTQGYKTGVFGATDITLCYQEQPSALWQHPMGRPDFISHESIPNTFGGFYTGSCPVTIGDRQYMYVSQAHESHAWFIDDMWKVLPDRRQQLFESGLCSVGIVSWETNRLFGLRSDPQGQIALRLPVNENQRYELFLNYTTVRGGSIRTWIYQDDQLTTENALPLTDSGFESKVTFKSGSTIQTKPGQTYIHIVLELETATLWAWDLRPAT
jgi:hypothetical protein